MPDADKAHSKLPGPYQPPYRSLCEGQNPNVIARGFASGLKKSLKYHGNEPLQAIKKTAGRVHEHLGEPLFRNPSDHRGLLDAVEDIAHKEITNRRAAGITIKACKQALNEIMSRPDVDSDQFEHLACAYYVRDVFEESCTCRLQNTPVHDLGIEHEEIETRMQIVREELEEYLGAFARQIEISGDATKLRMPGKKQAPELDLHDDNLLKL